MGRGLGKRPTFNVTAISASEFWVWSLTHYEREGVEPLLLQLQDLNCLDANMLLWACWCATAYEVLPEKLVREAITKTAPWATNVTSPLRQARRNLKKMLATKEIIGAEALRIAIKQNELMAEKIEQEVLGAMAAATLRPVAASPNDTQPRANANLSLYASLAGPLGNSECANPLLESLVRLIFADTSKEVCSKDDHGD